MSEVNWIRLNWIMFTDIYWALQFIFEIYILDLEQRYLVAQSEINFHLLCLYNCDKHMIFRTIGLFLY